MKPLKNKEDKVLSYLKKQVNNEATYNQKFVEAREIQKKRELERETEYNKFKRFQDKQKSADEMLREYLTRIKE